MAKSHDAYTAHTKKTALDRTLENPRTFHPAQTVIINKQPQTNWSAIILGWLVGMSLTFGTMPWWLPFIAAWIKKAIRASFSY